MNYCTVCKKEYASTFCPNCGQRKVTGKITFWTFLNDLFNNMFAFDKSLFTNVKSLILNPYHIVNNYLNGYRGYYSSPGKLFVITSILLALVFSITNAHFFNIRIEKTNFQEQFQFLIIFILLLSLSSYLAYYIKWKKNLIKHIIINIYNISLWTLLFIPLAFINHLFIKNNFVSSNLVYLYILLIVIWNNRTFKINSIWKRIAYILVNLILFGIFVFIILK